MKTFRIGICMAGAVSAGAYTAGVMDYLLEALSEWEKRRGEPGIPTHRVTVPILGGASAGGMTSLLTASTINNPLASVPVPETNHVLDEHPENKLYHSWVDLTHRDMFPKMLNTSDITGKGVLSLLNSDFIDEVADSMIKADPDAWIPTPAYFELPVKVFTTLSNLGGFHYNVDFIAGRRKEKYDMSIHNDYACFEISDEKTVNTPGWMPLDFKNGGPMLRTAKDAAMATGAFPVGLKSRLLERPTVDVKEIPWLRNIFGNTPLEGETVKTLNVDGGMINNEPYEKVRDLLDDFTSSGHNLNLLSMEKRQDALTMLNSNFNTFENTVLMIDPFPSKSPAEFKYDQGLFGVIGKTLSAMTSQMRAKPIDYRAVMEMSDAGRFIISPSREIRNKNNKVTDELFGEKAIACGALSGFGGFLSKEFRVHDYYLGRYNCEIFLRDYFTVTEAALRENAIFRDGYEGADTTLFTSSATGENPLSDHTRFRPET